MASRQVANSAWLAELSKIAAKSVTTYKSTSRIIPMIAKICLEVIFVFLFCVFLSCDICIPFVIPIHNSQKSGSAGAVRGSQRSGSAGAVRGPQKSGSAGAVCGSQKSVSAGAVRGSQKSGSAGAVRGPQKSGSARTARTVRVPQGLRNRQSYS